MEYEDGSGIINFNVEYAQCIDPECSGKMYNHTLLHKLFMIKYGSMGDIDLDVYPPEICNAFNNNDDDKEYSLNLIGYDGEELDDETECCYSTYTGSDCIMCDTCNKFYTICIKCKAPCILKTIGGGYFTCCDGDAWVSRRVINSIEEIAFRVTDGEYSSPITPNTKIIYIDEDDTDVKIIDKHTGNVLSTMDSTEWIGSYDIEDKHIIFSNDNKLALKINGHVMLPLINGPDGGLGLNVKCVQCDGVYKFNDK